jgi:hypothetical protein
VRSYLRGAMSPASKKSAEETEMYTAHELFVTAETEYRRDRLMSIRPNRRHPRVRHPRRGAGSTFRAVLTGGPSARTV